MAWDCLGHLPEWALPYFLVYKNWSTLSQSSSAHLSIMYNISLQLIPLFWHLVLMLHMWFFKIGELRREGNVCYVFAIFSIKNIIRCIKIINI